MPEPGLDAYDSRLTPAVFDFMVRWIYWPARTADVRARLVELLELAPGTSVLEPGAGTGGITRLMLDAGAQVTCVDRAPLMLERLRARAPEARVVVSPAADFRSEERFDRALLALFLHEQSSEGRIAILRMARAHLAPGGRIVVADSSAPDHPIGRPLWRAFLRTFEPPTVLEVADGALEHEILEAGFAIHHTESLAHGRLRAWVAS
jgi:SAM-dependent methyltransferase